MGRGGDRGTGGKNLRRRTSPRLPVRPSPRLKKSAFRNPSAFAARRADAELLAGFEAYVFAALRHDARRARAAADDRADGRALAAARDAADDRAYPGTRADLRH